MAKITTIGIDLAKNIFHIVCCDQHGKEISKRQFRRSQMLTWFAKQASCLVGMEACSGAHYWARELEKLGHQVKLIPAQRVKAYVQGNKNDYNDARAIAEAVTRPRIRGVAIKTVEEQSMQSLHRLRSRRIQERTALINQIRGLLAEYGIVIKKGPASVRKALPRILEDGENGLDDLMRRLLNRVWQQLQTLEEDIAFYDGELQRVAQAHEACRRLQSIPGYGVVVASAFYSEIGTGQQFKRGRDASASLGLVPRQHSSGGKEVLLGISKQGDAYLRGLLIHGARSVLQHVGKKEDRLSRWAQRVLERRGYNKAVVALANKLARIGWAVLAHNTRYHSISV